MNIKDLKDFKIESTPEDGKPMKLSDLQDFVVEETQPEIGSLQSAGLGALKSASFGFADEAEAGLRSILPGQSNYEDLLKQIQERYKKAEEINPEAFMAGQVGGALAMPIPGAGLIKLLPQTGKIANLAKGAIGTVTGAGLPAAKTLKEMAIAGAKTGAAGGALYGAGEAEGLDRISGAASGAATGALTGAVLNPAVMKSIEGVGALGRGTKNLALGKEGQKALEYARSTKDRTVDFFDPKQFVKEARAAGDTLSEVSDKIVKQVTSNLKTQDEVISNYTLKDQDKMIEDAITALGKLKPTVDSDVSYIQKNIEYLQQLLPKTIRKDKKVIEEVADIVETPIIGKPVKALKNRGEEAVDVKAKLESKLNADLAQRRDLGEEATGQIKELITPDGELYYYPEIISKNIKSTAKEVTIPDIEINPPVRNLEGPELLKELNRLQTQAYDSRVASEYRAPIRNLEQSIRSEVSEAAPDFAQARTQNQRLSNLVEFLTEGKASTSGELSDAFKIIAKQDKTPEYFKTVNKIAETLSNVDADPKKLPQVEEARRIFSELIPDGSEVLKKFDQQKEILNLYKTAIDPKTITLTDIPSANIRSMIASTGREGGFVSTGRIAAGQKIGNIAKATDEQLTRLAQMGQDKYGVNFKPVFDELTKVIGDKTGMKRTATMFNLMQNPNYRQMLNDLNSETGEDENE